MATPISQSKPDLMVQYVNVDLISKRCEHTQEFQAMADILDLPRINIRKGLLSLHIHRGPMEIEDGHLTGKTWAYGWPYLARHKQPGWIALLEA